MPLTCGAGARLSELTAPVLHKWRTSFAEYGLGAMRHSRQRRVKPFTCLKKRSRVILHSLITKKGALCIAALCFRENELYTPAAGCALTALTIMEFIIPTPKNTRITSV